FDVDDDLAVDDLSRAAERDGHCVVEGLGVIEHLVAAGHERFAGGVRGDRPRRAPVGPGRGLGVRIGIGSDRLVGDGHRRIRRDRPLETGGIVAVGQGGTERAAVGLGRGLLRTAVDEGLDLVVDFGAEGVRGLGGQLRNVLALHIPSSPRKARTSTGSALMRSVFSASPIVYRPGKAGSAKDEPSVSTSIPLTLTVLSPGVSTARVSSSGVWSAQSSKNSAFLPALCSVRVLLPLAPPTS